MNRNNKRSLASLIQEYQSNDIISAIEKDYSRAISGYLPLEKLRFNPISRKQFFLDKRIKDLTESIKNNGMMSPILVRKTGDFYEVCGGYKRYVAAKKLHLKEVPVSIRDISDELLIYMVLSRGNKKLHDNILNKTYTYQILTKEYHVSRKDIAMISKTSVPQVTNILRLDNLAEEVKIALKKEKISYGQARVLIGLENQMQIEFLHKILIENCSVREIEYLVDSYKKPTLQDEKIKAFEEKEGCHITRTEKNLTLHFDSREQMNEFLDRFSGH